jgi:predicted N-formylglutamate amidohydrolase
MGPPNSCRISGTATGPGRGRATDSHSNPVVSENPEGAGPFVIICDHGSNRIPHEYGTFDYDTEALQTHIAWDPGALAVARRLSARLNAPLIWPDASRLLIDCNRPPEADSLIVTVSEGRPAPANLSVDDAERARRLAHIHGPYHAAIDACLARRLDAGLEPTLVAIHSFTPVYLGKTRPWHVGIVFDDDRRVADVLLDGLRADPALRVGANEPYSPADLVYYTVGRHARPRGLPATMVEIRNDEIASETDQRRWAERLAPLLLAAERDLAKTKHAMV